MDRIRAIGDSLPQFIVPIYSRTSAINSDPTVQGTGILLAVGSYRFMLTAAHVADLSGKAGKSLFLRRPGDTMQFRELGKELGYITTISKDEHHQDDPKDIAITSLPPEFVADLEVDHHFLTLGQVDPADPWAPQPSAYMVTGFPSELSSMGPLSFATTGMIFGGKRYEGDLAALPDYDPNYHVAIAFSRERLIDRDGSRKENLPDPGGASGGAIWRTLERGAAPALAGPADVRLVGIVHRWELGPKVLIGTQIEYVLGLIMEAFPGTRAVVNAHRHGWMRPGWKPRV